MHILSFRRFSNFYYKVQDFPIIFSKRHLFLFIVKKLKFSTSSQHLININTSPEEPYYVIAVCIYDK